MELAAEIAMHIREVQLNGDWVATNFKAQLEDVTWEQANIKIGSLNTIAALAFHVNYYVAGIINVLEGGTLDIRDKFSFEMEPITSQEDWDGLLDKSFANAERFATLVEQIPDEKLGDYFANEKYGSNRRNFQAMIEHSYYHLGQIVLLKKLIVEGIHN